MAYPEEIHTFSQGFWHRGESLYVLLDGACRDNAFGLVFSLQGVEEYRSLYLGTRYASVMEYGPILVRARPDGEFFHWFFEEGPQFHAGGFFFSNRSVPELHVQFQEFLEAKMPNGAKALFRFYDPRITKRGLTIMSDAERERFCQGISAYYISRSQASGGAYWLNVLHSGGGDG